MRIAYIAPYQGRDVVEIRPSLHNLSLATRMKVQLISELLQRNSHEVEVFSPGEIDRYQFRYYPAIKDAEKFDVRIPVSYSSALPIRFVCGLWSKWSTLRLFKTRHRKRPFDLVIIYNMKPGLMACADYAMRHLGLPVILDYEDDLFVGVNGEVADNLASLHHKQKYAKMMKRVAGCFAVSPHLLSQLPESTPKLLLRGVVGDSILKVSRHLTTSRNNWVVFSGTHSRAKGLEPLIAAWQLADLPGWELHIAGRGELTETLEGSCRDRRDIIFHGVLDREANSKLLGSAKIGINPHDISQKLGNVFAFKIIEILAAGMHCISTPMGFLEPEIEAGITYMLDNSPTTIAATLRQVIDSDRYVNIATHATQDRYGPDGVSRSLEQLIAEAQVSPQKGCKSNQ